MSGSATLGDNLVDDLVPTVDELREDLYSSLGVRQFRVYVVKRTWDGEERGDGAYTFDYENEVTPLPMVKDATRFDAEPHGRDDNGDIVLTEISLTYTEAELLGGTLDETQEFYFRIVDVRGQGIPPTYFVPAEKPTPDRENNIGWTLRLRRAAITEGVDGPPPTLP